MPRVDRPDIRRGDDDFGRFKAELLLDNVGLTQFAVFNETLWPGRVSSKSHWQAQEGQMVYVLEGNVTLIEDGVATDLSSGQAATFKANVPVGHHLGNRTGTPVCYFVIGTRSPTEKVKYPTTSETVTIDADEKIHRDATGTVTRRVLDTRKVT